VNNPYYIQRKEENIPSNIENLAFAGWVAFFTLWSITIIRTFVERKT